MIQGTGAVCLFRIVGEQEKYVILELPEVHLPPWFIEQVWYVISGLASPQ